MHLRAIILVSLMPLLLMAAVRKHALDSGMFDFSRDDRAFAESLVVFYDGLKDGKIDTDIIRNLRMRVRKSWAFDGFNPLIQQAYLVTQIKTSESFMRACDPGRYRNTNSSLARKMGRYLQRYCRERFLTLQLEKRPGGSLSVADKKYLAYAMKRYLLGEHRTLFEQFLQLKNRTTSEQRYLSELASQLYIKYRITPSSSTLQYLEITPPLHDYLNQIGFNERETKKYIRAEFRNLVSAFKTAVSDEDNEMASLLINHLLGFHAQNRQLLSADYAWKTFISAGRAFVSFKQQQVAMTIFNYAIKIADSEQKDESLFHLLYSYVVSGNYAEGLKAIERYNLIENFSKYSSRLRFWITHVLNNAGEVHLAQHLYKRIIETDPLGFYSIVAMKKLVEVTGNEKVNQSFLEQFKMSAVQPGFQRELYSKNFFKSIKRFSVWINLGVDKFSTLELNDIIHEGEQNFTRLPASTEREMLLRNTLLHMSDFLNKKRYFLHSFKLLYQSLERYNLQLCMNVIKNLFPIHYLPEITRVTKEIEPTLILSLIRQESAFNPNAQSVAGARGLMQLMPETARQIRKEVRPNQLHGASLNLKIGIKYLKSLLEKYDGNLIYTLAAYNAGPNRLNAWKKNVFISDDPLIMIEAIPYRETRQYVKLIYRNLFFYKFLHNDIDVTTPVQKSFQVSI